MCLSDCVGEFAYIYSGNYQTLPGSKLYALVWRLYCHRKLGIENIIPELAGRADLDGCDVYEIGLCIKIDDDSNGHANMFPFPDVT